MNNTQFYDTIGSLMFKLGRTLYVRDDFINYFIAKNILTVEEGDIIMCKEGQSAKNTAFLRIIMIKPEKKAMKVLLEALKNSAQPHLAKQIKEEYARQTASGTDNIKVRSRVSHEISSQRKSRVVTIARTEQEIKEQQESGKDEPKRRKRKRTDVNVNVNVNVVVYSPDPSMALMTLHPTTSPQEQPGSSRKQARLSSDQQNIQNTVCPQELYSLGGGGLLRSPFDMEPKHKDALKRKYFREKLQVNVSFLNFFRDEDIISREEIEQIKNEVANEGKSTKFAELLGTQPSTAIPVLIKALFKTSQIYLAIIVDCDLSEKTFDEEADKVKGKCDKMNTELDGFTEKIHDCHKDLMKYKADKDKGKCHEMNTELDGFKEKKDDCNKDQQQLAKLTELRAEFEEKEKEVKNFFQLYKVLFGDCAKEAFPANDNAPILKRLRGDLLTKADNIGTDLLNLEVSQVLETRSIKANFSTLTGEVKKLRNENQKLRSNAEKLQVENDHLKVPICCRHGPGRSVSRSRGRVCHHASSSTSRDWAAVQPPVISDNVQTDVPCCHH